MSTTLRDAPELPKRWLDRYGTEMTLSLAGAETMPERIKALMAFYRISLRGLSRDSGISLTSLHSIVTGRTKSPKLDTIRAIARALGTDAATLIGEGE